jgi:hypothetical protein
MILGDLESTWILRKFPTIKEVDEWGIARTDLDETKHYKVRVREERREEEIQTVRTSTMH